MKPHPSEFDLAMRAIEDAVFATETEGRDMRSLATSFVVHAANFYRIFHGTDGPVGLQDVLAKLAADAERMTKRKTLTVETTARCGGALSEKIQLETRSPGPWGISSRQLWGRGYNHDEKS